MVGVGAVGVALGVSMAGGVTVGVLVKARSGSENSLGSEDDMQRLTHGAHHTQVVLVENDAQGGSIAGQQFDGFVCRILIGIPTRDPPIETVSISNDLEISRLVHRDIHLKKRCARGQNCG